MKRFTLFSILAIVAMAACEREGDVDIDAVEEVVADAGGQHAYIVNPDEISMGAVIGAETRTEFDSYAGKFAWSEGDKIAIHLSDGTFYETEVNAETGVFTCSTTESKQRDAYAIYPASARDNSNYGTPILNVVLPDEYDIRDNLAGGYSPVPMIAVNRQGEDDLYFRHVGSLLRITCDRVPADTRFIAVTFDRNVAGTFTVVNPLSENPTISNGGSSATVTFRVAEDKLPERTDGIVLNVPVPVGALTTMKVAALDASGVELRYSEREIPSLSRGYGKKVICNIIPAFADSMQMEIWTSSNGDWFTLSIFDTTQSFPADVIIDWGDGTATSAIAEGSQVSDMSASLTHSYRKRGYHIITITAIRDAANPGPMVPDMSFSNNGSVTRMLTPLLRMEKTSANEMFYQCGGLSTVCGDLFSKNPQITDFTRLFQWCDDLQFIPEDIFAYNPDATIFDEAFSVCYRISEIPAGLFAHNPKAESFYRVFEVCKGIDGQIPEDLFANNPAALSFDGVFEGCKNLKGPIPADLFAHNPLVTRFSGTFSGCSSLDGEIPPDLFSCNKEAIDFSHTFASCPNLTGSIPGRLFASNSKATRFYYTFIACSGLTGSIPENLFAHNPDAYTFSDTFTYCSGLTGSIPEKLFANNTRAGNFTATFMGCTGLTGPIPKKLFANNGNATEFSYTFSGCTSLVGPIPEGFFANNTRAMRMYNMFEGCTSLSGPVPDDLFASNPELTSLKSFFKDCVSLTGPIPEHLLSNNYHNLNDVSQMFNGCSGLTGPIPANLFPEVQMINDVTYLFKGCTGLSGPIPGGLFTSTSTYKFKGTFQGCSQLTLVADIFTNESLTPENRFMINVPYDFENCFQGTGGGTAPALWDFTFSNPDNVVKTGCFSGLTNLTNWGAVDDAWR